MDEALKVLMGAKTIAVVGLDNREFRTAYRIAEYLQDAGYRIVPVPFQQPAEEVLGEKAYPSVREIPFPVDVVDVFVRSEQTTPVIEDAVAAGAKCVWLQAGITNPPALEKARQAGVVTAQNRCTMVEHRAAR